MATNPSSKLKALSPPMNFTSWKSAGATFLEMIPSTDGVLNLLNLKGVNPEGKIVEDNSIKSLLISIGKWVKEGTTNQNLGRMLSQAFTRMLKLEGKNPKHNPPIDISSTQLMSLSVELEERLVRTLNEDDWQEMGYTDVMQKAFGDNVGGIKPFRPKNQQKRKETAQKKIISLTKTLNTLKSELQNKCVKFSLEVNFFPEDNHNTNYDAIKTALESLERTASQIDNRAISLNVEQTAASHGYGFTLESVRDTILAPVANTTQCQAVIGDYKKDGICYLCGLPFNVGVKETEAVQVDCEHVLGVQLAGMYINLVQGGLRIFNKEEQNYKEILKLEYLWAHHCCNIIKLDEPFINKEGLFYVVYEQKIDEMIHGIISKAQDNSENLGCRKLAFGKKEPGKKSSGKKASDLEWITTINNNIFRII